MKRHSRITIALSAAMPVTAQFAWAGQAPGSQSDADIPVSHHDRVYAAEQFSNTVSVIDPADNKLLGLIRLGDPSPGNFSPLYKGHLLVHGMGYSPDHHTIAVVSRRECVGAVVTLLRCLLDIVTRPICQDGARNNVKEMIGPWRE